MNRRTFLKSTNGIAFAQLAGCFLSQIQTVAAPPQPHTATGAVIGHSGRGDYGHGWEKVFVGRTEVKRVVLADPDPTGRNRIGKQIGAAALYADYKEMLAKERPRWVSLAMRHADQHHQIGLAILRSGAHLFCEKPFTRSKHESDELLKEAKKRGLIIAVPHTLRLNKDIRILRQWVSEGKLGDLRILRAQGKQDSRSGGEDMMVLGVHLFDLMRWFAGDPVSVSAKITDQGVPIHKEHRRLVKDNVGWVAGNVVLAQFGFKSGALGIFQSDSATRDTLGPWGIELIGSKGKARIVCDGPRNAFIMSQHPNWTREATEIWRPVSEDDLATPLAQIPNPAEDWFASCRDAREPICSGKNGAVAVEMVMASYQSALNNSMVRWPLKHSIHPLGSRRDKLPPYSTGG